MNNKHQEDLSHIRSMMERSSRFISLSGLSGVCAGIAAIAGAVYAYYQINIGEVQRYISTSNNESLLQKLILDATLVLLISLTCAILLTVSKSKKTGVKIWSAATKNLLLHLLIPLIAGGIFCIGLIYYEAYIFVAPATLVFYGLSLINASKYTYNDIFYLGICETILGLASLFFPGHGLIFWTIGFGVLHIIYGALMYNKYK